jgi:rubredoxin
MAKYKCKICGFVYDEAQGYAKDGIKPDTKWEDVEASWQCPLCAASKDDFELLKEESTETKDAPRAYVEFDEHELTEMNSSELGVLFSGMAKACSKQYLYEEFEAFDKLSKFFMASAKPVEAEKIETLIPLVLENLNKDYPMAAKIAEQEKDRGALRVCTWGERVTNMLSSLLARFEKQQEAMLENTGVYVCEACGFIFVGNELPDVCPVCKVPKSRMIEMGGA